MSDIVVSVPIFDTAHGPAMLVREEDQGHGLEYLWATVDPKSRAIATHWSKTIPKNYELVHDVGARVEANLALHETAALIQEKAVLLECLSAALGMLDERAAEQVRDIYRAKVPAADITSLTKPGDIVHP